MELSYLILKSISLSDNYYSLLKMRTLNFILSFSKSIVLWFFQELLDTSFPICSLNFVHISFAAIMALCWNSVFTRLGLVAKSMSTLLFHFLNPTTNLSVEKPCQFIYEAYFESIWNYPYIYFFSLSHQYFSTELVS